LQQFGDMLPLILRPIVLIFIISAFFYVLIEQSIQNFLPTFNNKVLLISPALSIQMTSILAGSTALGRFLAGLLLRKLNWFAVLVSCLLIAAAIILFTMPVIKQLMLDYKGTGINELKDVPMIAFVFPLIGLVLAPIYPAINSIILSSLPKPKHGLMSGLIIIFSALGGTTGSLIMGRLFEGNGGQTAMYFALIPITILIISLYFFKRQQKKSIAVSNISTPMPLQDGIV